MSEVSETDLNPLVVVHIVTYNNEDTIERCLESVFAQRVNGIRLKVLVSDNHSQDKTLPVIEQRFSSQLELIQNHSNLGFAAGHNRGIERALAIGAQYLFLMNPDLVLLPDTLQTLVDALKSDPLAGSATPKILRAGSELEPVVPHRFDSTGIYMTPSIRHFDRASQELDVGQYEKSEYVFGATGAAVLLRKDFILDAAFRRPDISAANGGLANGRPSLQLFDDTFFCYREDADLAWRAQYLGWRCRYVPEAVSYHRRSVLPENRTSLPAELNSFSVRNRFLLQINNFSLLANLRCILPTLFRNVLVIVGVFAVERTSRRGLADVFHLLPSAWKTHGRDCGFRSSLTASLFSLPLI